MPQTSAVGSEKLINSNGPVAETRVYLSIEGTIPTEKID